MDDIIIVVSAEELFFALHSFCEALPFIQTWHMETAIFAPKIVVVREQIVSKTISF